MKKTSALVSLLFLCNIASLLPETAQRKEISEKDQKLFRAAQEGDVETVREYIENNEYCDGTDNEGNNLYHIAAQHGRTEIIEELSRDLGWWKSYIYGPSLPDINGKNHYEDTPLHCASHAGHTETAETLIKKQANIKALNREQISAAFIALKKDNPKLVKAFIMAGLDPATYENNGIHMFHYAIENHANHTIEYFSKQKKLLNQSGKKGIKPIHVAAKSDNIVGLNILLHYGADLQATDDNGNTAGHYSAWYGTKKFMERLLQLPEFDLNKLNKLGNNVPSIAIYYGKNDIVSLLFENAELDINAQHPDGSSYAMIAAQQGNNKALEFFVNSGANLRITDGQGRNILHIIGKTNNYQGAESILKKDSSLLCITDINGKQPLFAAMESENPNLVQLYIDFGAPLNTIDKTGNSILHHAVLCKKTTFIPTLLSRGAPVVTNKYNGLQFYHHMVEQEDVNGIKELKKYNVNLDALTPMGNNLLQFALTLGKRTCAHELLLPQFINHKNNNGTTSAMIAAQKNMTDIIRELRKINADLTATDNNGADLTHHAAANNSVPVLKLLADYGFSFARTTNDGNTAMHIAAMNGHTDAIRFFKERGQNFRLRNKDGQTSLLMGAFAGRVNVIEELLDDQAYRDGQVADILNSLHRSTGDQRKVYQFVKQQHEARSMLSYVIEQEYHNTRHVIDSNKLLLQELVQQGDVAAALETFLYNPQMPEYKNANQIYMMDYSQQIQLQTTYLSYKNAALQDQASFQQRLNKIVEQKAQVESKARADAVRYEIQERDRRIAADQQARRDAARAKEKQERKEKKVVKEQQRKATNAQQEYERKKNEAIRAQEQGFQQYQQNAQPNVQPNMQSNTSQRVTEQDLDAYLKQLQQPSTPSVDDNNNNNNDNNASEEEQKKEPECSICYQAKPLIPYPCGKTHEEKVCAECLVQWKAKNPTCPMCRGLLK